MRTACEAAATIIAGFEETNRLLPLAGGIPRPIEESTDKAVVVALAYQKLKADVERLRAREAELVAMLRQAPWCECVNHGGGECSWCRTKAALLAKGPTT